VPSSIRQSNLHKMLSGLNVLIMERVWSRPKYITQKMLGTFL
jgi:hypothetical protein